MDAIGMSGILANLRRCWGAAPVALRERVEGTHAMLHFCGEAKTLWVPGWLTAEQGNPATARVIQAGLAIGSARVSIANAFNMTWQS